MSRVVKAVFFLMFGLLSAHAQRLSLACKSDSAIHYYYQGWYQVMDAGNYTLSERAYRKMSAIEPGFLVGMCLLGRISTDPKERERIELLLEAKKVEVKDDERLLLDVFLALLHFTNAREKDSQQAKQLRSPTFALAQRNMGIIARKYPDEIYYKAEYIEVLHANHGAKVALDSLRMFRRVSEKLNPFLIGYEAILLGELGDREGAMGKANLLKTLNLGPTATKFEVTAAAILLMTNEKAEAKAYLERALKIDAGNLDARRLKLKLDELSNPK